MVQVNNRDIKSDEEEGKDLFDITVSPVWYSEVVGLGHTK